jgi:hypothetical protein
MPHRHRRHRSRSPPATSRSSHKKLKVVEEYLLPEDLLAVQHEHEPFEEPWPGRALIFKAFDCWPVSEAGARDELVFEVLSARGWRYGGTPCDPNDYGTLPQALAGKAQQYPLPRRALWIPNNSAEIKMMHEAFNDTRLAARFRVAGLPGSGPTCFKTYTAKALAHEPFVPRSFVLPAQRAELLGADAAARGAEEKQYWIGKPKCNYSGRGITITRSVADVADGTGVVQTYIERPLLVGGYKVSGARVVSNTGHPI